MAENNEDLVEHPGQLKMNFSEIPNHEYKRPSFEEEYLRDSREEAQATEEAIEEVTLHMREWFFKHEGWFAPDEVVFKEYWKNYSPTATIYTAEVLKAFGKVAGTPGKVISLVQDGGGGRNYYDLPPGAEQLLDLIEHRNMNGNIKDIFKACYRLGEKEGTSEEYDLRKMVLYSIRELGRVTGRKDYVDLATEVVGHHDRIRDERLNSLTH